MSQPVVLVCSTIHGPNAAQESCSQCEATIWPTAGSRNCAAAQKLPMICTDCYAKIDDSVFGGWMQHGVMLPKALGERLFVEYQLATIREKIGRNRSI